MSSFTNAYLAGPDVFVPRAREHAAAKVAICKKYCIVGRPPIDDDVQSSLPGDPQWKPIFRKNIKMMEECDIVIANLTPFRGASADAGTLVELGWFYGRSKLIFAYSNNALTFEDRSRQQIAAIPDPITDLSIEGFGQADNLMIPGAIEYGGPAKLVLPQDGISRDFDSLEIFEQCVAQAAALLKIQNKAN